MIGNLVSLLILIAFVVLFAWLARRARAHSCWIRLSLADALQVEVADDGVGLPEVVHAGVGLTSMRERAAELGGTCAIERAATGGTRVVAKLPLMREP